MLVNVGGEAMDSHSKRQICGSARRRGGVAGWRPTSARAAFAHWALGALGQPLDSRRRPGRPRSSSRLAKGPKFGLCIPVTSEPTTFAAQIMFRAARAVLKRPASRGSRSLSSGLCSAALRSARDAPLRHVHPGASASKRSQHTLVSSTITAAYVT